MQTFYTVRAGDTVSAIAKRWELPTAAVIAANRLEQPDRIVPGQQLSLPGGVTTVVVLQGDTVYGLAQSYGIPAEAIIEANRLSPPYTIYIGQALTIPPGVPYYVVQPGDTLFALASRYNVRTNDAPRPELIRAINRLPSDTIVPGMRLVIPYAPPGGSGAVAYVADFGGDFDLWLYDPSTGRPTPIGSREADRHSVPFWSPDSRRIAFIGKENVLIVLDVARRTLTRIDQLEPFTTLSWSPDGTRLAYTKADQIVMYELLAYRARTLPVSGAKHVQWFPSGDRLLYAAQDAAGNDQLYEVRTDGTGRRQITRHTSGPMNDVRLSPQGDRALFTSPGASISLLFVVDLRTGAIRELESGPLGKNYFPTWSPDGSTLAYSSTEFVERKGYFSTIRTQPGQGGGQRVLAVSDCFATPVTWSPGGRAIVYVSGCRGEQSAGELWIVDTARPAPVRALVGAGMITSVSWSPGAVPDERYAMYRNPVYRVSFPYPASWRQVSETRYEGDDGFFEISALASELPFHELCQAEANHRLRPYGTSPRVVPGRVQGQEACYIFPSADQAPEFRGQAALLVVYPEPVVINGNEYPHFILWADQNHLVTMANGLRFI